MNKNDILIIARSLYLQQTIARQLFAKFDIDQDFSQFGGSFAQLAQKLSSSFYGFIGSYQDNRKNAQGQRPYVYTQIIQKNGMKFKIHKMNTDNTVSNQLYKNKQFTLNQVAFELTTLYVMFQKGGQSGLSGLINQIKKQWFAKEANQNIKINAKRGNTLIKQLQQIKQYFLNMSCMVIGQIKYIAVIDELKTMLSKLKDQYMFGAGQNLDYDENSQDEIDYDNIDQDEIDYDNIDQNQFDIFSNKLLKFLIEFEMVVKNRKSFINTIDMAINRLKAFIQLYKQVSKRLQSQPSNEMFSAILWAMQNCNDNTQLSKEIQKINVKKELGVNNYDLIPHSIYDGLLSFIRFIKQIDDKKDRIQFTNLNVAIQYYLDLQDGILSDQTKACLIQLKQAASKIEKQNRAKDQIDLDGKAHILYAGNLTPDLISKIKNCYNQLCI